MSVNELFRGIGYHPHAGQLAFHGNDARFKLLIAGARFGKSLASAREMLVEMLAGGTRGWLVGPTYALALPEYRYIREDMLRHLRARCLSEQAGLPSRLTADWGAEVVRMSAHNAESLLGEEIDWLIMCEAAHMEREAYERFLRARLVSRNGRLVVATTPRGHNWIYELYRRAERLKDWQVLRFATADNPRVSDEELSAARAALPADVFAEQFEGAFTTPHGAVYPEFDRGLHVVDGLEPAPGDLILRGIDFGYTHPFACLWACVDGDGCLNILREHYRAGMPMADHAEAIRRVDDEFLQRGCVLGPAIVDPSGAEQRDLLRYHGINVMKADNRLRGGIEQVRRRLLPGTDGRPALRVDSRCANLLREMSGYVWREGGEAPLKRADHALDALRYLCAYVARHADWKHRGTLW
jgi:hypothetical protein